MGQGWSPESIVAVTGGVCAAISGLLALLWTKGYDARIRLLKAQDQGDARKKAMELASEQECTQELSERVTKLEKSHEECTKNHATCERSLAELTGYMKGKFEDVHRNLAAVTKVSVVTDLPAATVLGSSVPLLAGPGTPDSVS